MRKILLAILVLIVAFVGYGAYFITSQLPSLAHKQAQSTLRSMGFQDVALSEPEVRIQAARYERITLDADGISTIDSLEIHYSPFSLLVMQQPSVVKIDGLTLVGELSTANKVSIAGWSAKDAKLNLQSGNLRRMVIQNSRLSLLTDTLGGINIDFDLQTRTRGKQVDIQGHVRSQQKHISAIAGVKGYINQDGIWQAELDITQSKLGFDAFRVTRMNGTAQITGAPGRSPQVSAQLQAGGVNMHGYPWQNAVASFEGDLDSFRISADMKSIGYTGVELALSVEKQADATQVSGQLHSENFGKLTDYLAAHEGYPFSEEAFAAFENTPGLTLGFETSLADNAPIKFSLTNTDNAVNITGEAALEEKRITTANFTSSAIFLKDFEALNSPESQHFTSGHLKLSGSLEGESATIKADILDGSYLLAPLKLSNISGAVLIDNIETLSGPKNQTLTCHLPLKKEIEQECAITLDIKNSEAILKAARIDIFGGTLSVNDYAPGTTPLNFTIKGDGIDAWELSQALGIKGISTTGTFSVEIPLYHEDGAFIIRGGTIRSEGKGLVRYTYEDSPAFFEGDEFELETMKQALKNYNYEFLEMKISGPLNGPDVFVVGRGFNPDMFERRPIALNFKTKANPEKLLANILP